MYHAHCFYRAFISSLLTHCDTGRPEPPRDVTVACNISHATVTWFPGADNNDPITDFVVQFRESSPSASTGSSNEVEFQTGATLSGSGKTASSRIQQSLMMATVFVRPWRSYEFRVISKNGLGEGNPSSTARQRARCVTPQKIPSVNPRGVCTRLRATGQLVIVWEVYVFCSPVVVDLFVLTATVLRPGCKLYRNCKELQYTVLPVARKNLHCLIESFNL